MVEYQSGQIMIQWSNCDLVVVEEALVHLLVRDCVVRSVCVWVCERERERKSVWGGGGRCARGGAGTNYPAERVPIERVPITRLEWG